MQLYFSFIEEDIKRFYNTLNEKGKRLYAAVEAIKIGYGGITYISEIVGCSRKTVARGMRELFALSDEKNANKRIRLPGGGRKPYYKIHENIDEQFLDVINDYTAGNPMNEKVKWTNLTPKEIAEELEDKHAVRVSEIVIRQLLRKHNFRRRKAQKSKTAKQVKNRDQQLKTFRKSKRNIWQTRLIPLSVWTLKRKRISVIFIGMGASILKK
jgi:hypothetical protein